MLKGKMLTQMEEERANRHDPVRAGLKFGTLFKEAMNVLTYEVTTGATSIKIFDGNAPYKFEVIDVIIQPRGASTSGTMKLTNGTSDITDAMTCAIDETIARPTTIDASYATIERRGTLEIVCGGTTPADTIGLVTIVIIPKE